MDTVSGVSAAKYLKYLQLKIVRRLDGILQGDYTGIFYGPGMELGEVREYQHGDDVRHIDWSVTARTNRVHIRQFIEERELTAWLVVDLSASIAFGTSQQSKMDLVTQFCGLAAHLYSRHGDKVGLIGFSGEVNLVIPPRSGRAQTLRILSALMDHEQRNAAAEDPSRARIGTQTWTSPSDLAGALERAMRFIRRRSLVFVISDFLVPQGWERPLRNLATRHDVIAVRVVDPREQEIPDVGLIRFEDPETGEQIWVDTGHAGTRERFRVAVEDREQQLASSMALAAVDLLTLTTAETIVEPLLRFVALRKRRRPWSSLGR